MQASVEIGGLDYEEEVDESCSIRTEDIMCLMCTSGDSTRRGFLAAEGFGSQTCHLEPEPRNQEPCELQQCIFQLEDAMSVHAMYSSGLSLNKQHSSCKILMYGHAVLLRHLGTKELLCSLTTSPENDKMAYNVGFDFETDRKCRKERCWFRILPASNQRSEGEKVRAGDDVFLVNVANERYLFAQMSSDQNAESEKCVSKHQSSVQVSFHQCIWNLHIVCSGSAKEAAIGNVNGGDVVRFIHRYWGGGDILTVKGRKTSHNVMEWIPDNSFWNIQYERPDNNHQLRSLWRVELFQMKFGGGFTSWEQPFRLRHLITGTFLGVKEDGESPKKKKHIVALLSPSEASKDATAFCFVNSAAKHRWTKTQVLGMGRPEIHFGDSEVYLYHINSGKYLGFSISEHHNRRSAVNLRKAIMQADFNQSFAFTMTRASSEQAKAANIVQLSESVMRNYVHKVLLSREPAAGDHLETNLSNILKALIHYFRVPDKLGLPHDQYQQQLCGLRERQNLFNKQGMLKFTLTVITETARNVPSGGFKRMEILHSLYELLAAMIRGNHDNCCEFATEKWLGVFMRQLSLPEVTHKVLTVIQCLLTDSPEVLNIFSPHDIGIIVNLLNTNGRDSKVMKLLSSLCVCHGVAMRDKQKLIYKHLLNCNELLVQTSHHAKVHSLHPDLYIGMKAGSAAYTKWYYEVQVTTYSATSGHTPHLRIGWAHATLFKPHPCSNGTNILDGGIGDDVFSMSFDGANLWIGGNSVGVACSAPSTTSKCLRRQEEISSPPLSALSTTPFCVGDVIGCCIDLEAEVAWFTKNGKPVKGHVKFHHCNDMITPAISFSSGINLVLSLGGSMGCFTHTTPPSYAGLYEAAEPGRDITLIPFLCLGHVSTILVSGPPSMTDFESFVPAPIDTSKITLPDCIASSYGSMRDMLAKNIHEVWSKNKIEAGFSYAPVRNDDFKHNPSLRAFEDLADGERSYDYDMALKTLMTLVALGYQISTAEELEPSHICYLELPADKYVQSNGYIPRPLNLDAVDVPQNLSDLVEKLAENAHNIWASRRIKEGWTYGKANDVHARRNPLLMPYSKLSQVSKKSNYDTALESVRTVCGLGCTVTPPTSGGLNINQLMREFSESGSRTKTFRGQKCYRVVNGKWYYEVKLLTGGMMRIGWATPSFEAGKLLGSDNHSYAYDGHLSRKWHTESENFGRRWSKGDIVGCLLDINEKTMSFTLNGELLYDSEDSSIAFDNIDASDGLMPAMSLAGEQRAEINFGHSSDELEFYDYLMNAGYIALCSPKALQYNIPMWYSSHGGFEMLDNQKGCNCKFITARTPSSISVSCLDWDYSVQSDQECLRLNMGCTVDSSDSSHCPTLIPRPSFLSPSPLAEDTLDRVLGQPRPTTKPICFSVVFQTGQVPCLAFVGWTTATFRYMVSQYSSREDQVFHDRHSHSSEYGQCMEVANTSNIDEGNSSEDDSSMRFNTAFMVCLCDLLPAYTPQLTNPVRVSCTLDQESGEIAFISDALSPAPDSPVEQQSITFAAHHGAKLFPTVVVTPTTEVVVEFDFSPCEKSRPLSSCFIAPMPTTASGSGIPLCPPRLQLMVYSKSQWVRQSTRPCTYSTESSGTLKVFAREEQHELYVTLPQEDIVMNILEISEDLKLMGFQVRTLEALCAVCSHSNLALAKSINQYFSSEQLLKCLKVDGLRFELRAAYLKLLTFLHLDHQVQTKLLTRGEFVLPRNECTKPVPLFMAGGEDPAASSRRRNHHQQFSLRNAPLPGCNLLASSIRHNITSSFSQAATGSTEMTIDFSIAELKELVFHYLENLLHSDYYKMYLLPADSRSPIFVPMIEALDHLLVMGVLKEERDLQRLLHLLDPNQFELTDSDMQFEEGLLCQKVSNEEPMKVALCVLLQHLCDCQVRHRVESMVSFSHDYVEKLQEEQKQRHKENIRKKPKEFRSSSEMQVEGMLTLKSDYSCSRRLREELKTFTESLMLHCGASLPSSQTTQELSSAEKLKKLKKLVKLVTLFNECPQHEAGPSSHVITLQRLITQTMITWGNKDIQDLRLIEEIFSLLYRQFNEVGELTQALKKTYVLEVSNDQVTDKPNFDIPAVMATLR